MIHVKHITLLSLIIFNMSYSSNTLAQCRDLDAIEATDKAALKFFKRAELFERGKVLKVHLPSRRKETASYIKNNGKFYTFFGQVELDCSARIMKRTHSRP